VKTATIMTEEEVLDMAAIEATPTGDMDIQDLADLLTPETAPIVRVEWSDITMHDEWNEKTTELGDSKIVSVGWLIRESEKDIVICKSYDYDAGEWSEYVFFPKAEPSVERLDQAPP